MSVCMYELINLWTAVSTLITLCIEYGNIETNSTEGTLLYTEGHRHPSSSYNPKLKLTLNLTLKFDYINNNQLDPINCFSENGEIGFYCTLPPFSTKLLQPSISHTILTFIAFGYWEIRRSLKNAAVIVLKRLKRRLMQGNGRSILHSYTRCDRRAG